MEMANCRKCKKVFPRISDPICDSCKKEEEDLFRSVVEYLRDNPGSSVNQVSEATGATAKKIMGYLRDGRIEISTSELSCRQCGVRIKTGIYCDTCQVEVNLQISNLTANNAASKPLGNDGNRVIMHSKKK